LGGRKCIKPEKWRGAEFGELLHLDWGGDGGAGEKKGRRGAGVGGVHSKAEASAFA